MSESSGHNDWNQKNIEEFRANEGKIGGYFEGAHMILIHHIGARSGTERVNPLTYLPDGDDMIITATKGGAPKHPDWRRLVELRPGFAAYETKTSRVFPMFRLTRRS